MSDHAQKKTLKKCKKNVKKNAFFMKKNDLK